MLNFAWAKIYAELSQKTKLHFFGVKTMVVKFRKLQVKKFPFLVHFPGQGPF